MRYGTKTDIWSLGVIIFILLGGYPPFADEIRELQDDKIKSGEFNFIEEYWSSVSAEARHLIKSLLVVDPRQRFSASDALIHPWFRTERHILRRHSLHNSQKSIEANFQNQKFQRAVKKVSALLAQ